MDTVEQTIYCMYYGMQVQFNIKPDVVYVGRKQYKEMLDNFMEHRSYYSSVVVGGSVKAVVEESFAGMLIVKVDADSYLSVGLLNSPLDKRRHQD